MQAVGRVKGCRELLARLGQKSDLVVGQCRRARKVAAHEQNRLDQGRMWGPVIRRRMRERCDEPSNMQVKAAFVTILQECLDSTKKQPVSNMLMVNSRI